MYLQSSRISNCYRRVAYLATALASLALPLIASSEETSSNNSGAGVEALFEFHKVLQVELHGPIEKLFTDTSNGKLSFQIVAQGMQQPVGVTTGGKSRRRVCESPPLRLDLIANTDSRSPSPDSVFKGHQFLYLTPQCNFTTRSGADLIEEYLAYRILNLITEFSYRVRLLEVNYIDTLRVGKTRSHYAFVTESQQVLARRMGGEVLQAEHVEKWLLNEDHAALIYVFQYLIGNTDWSLVSAEGGDTCCHNGQLIAVDSHIFYIPFDFDLSGLVNPRYAYPDKSLPIRRVTQRLYRGYCGPEDSLKRALERIIEQREAILRLYEDAPLLSQKKRKSGIEYLERFYKEANNPDSLLASFRRRCLG